MAAATGPNTAGWGRRRLLGILAVAVGVAAVLLFGLCYSGYQIVRSTHAGEAPGRGAGEQAATTMLGADRRNEIAAAPMLAVTAAAMNPAPPTDQAAAAIHIPAGTVVGPAAVLTGFPHTPEGAVGQLAQIESTVLQMMSLSTAYDAYQAWALPGGAGVENWGLTTTVRAFLDSAQMGQSKAAAAAVTTQPVGAQVKGTDGPDWVTACVLMKASAVYRSASEVAFGYCERMQWAGGRWMVAPGTPPAPAPSTWPGTELSNQAGWHTWISAIPTESNEEGHR